MIALATICAGPDPMKDSILEMVLGDYHWTFRMAGVRGDYSGLIEAVDTGLLAECRDSEGGPYRPVIEAALFASDPEPILCYDPWHTSALHLQEDFGIEHPHFSTRLIDIRSWGFPGHLDSIKQLAEKYGIRWNPTGRARDEADVILKIAKVRDGK